LADQTVDLTKKSHDILQLRTDIFFELNHIYFRWWNNLRVQEQHHVWTCNSQTTWQIKLAYLFFMS